MRHDVDLAIVGAGPAGAAAALHALQHAPDLAVALIDRARFPRDKTCGDGVGPEAVDVLRRLGVMDVLDGFPSQQRIRIGAPGGEVVSGDAPRAGYVIPRTIFDARLRAAAIARGAIPVQARVRDLEQGFDGVRVAGLRARWLVGADGANSVVRRLVGAPAQPRSRTGLAMRGYARAETDTLYIGFVTEGWPAYVWAFPTGTGQVNIGYGPFDSTRARGRRSLRAALERHLPELRAAPDTLRAHRLPLSTFRPPPVHGRVMLVGDAASLVNPLTGEGIYYALLSGALAGAAAGREPEQAGRVYRAALDARLGRHLRHTRLGARLLQDPRPVDLSVAAAAGSRRAFADLCEFALGTGTITPALAATLTGTSLRHGRDHLRRAARRVR